MKNNWAKFFPLFTLSILVGGKLFGLGPLPMLLIRRNLGRGAALFTMVAGIAVWLGLGDVMAAVSFAASSLLALVFSECENLNLGYTTSGLVTLLVCLGTASAGVGYGMNRFGLDPVALVSTQIDMAVRGLNQGGAQQATLNKEVLLNLFPALLFVVGLMTLWLSTVLANQVEKSLKWKAPTMLHVYSLRSLRFWRLPDEYIWLALASVAASFFQIEPKWVQILSQNLLFVSVVLYFYQGLAVVVDFFELKKVSPIWRVLAYSLAFIQLFPVVVCLGFVDYWADFRARQRADKRPAI
ncbi:MAG: DUF2232 domain-containing protein [Oligoflexia bacterium]|nr:DUF2232 domain-containing protein [Oligoflexia bacterium]